MSVLNVALLVMRYWGEGGPSMMGYLRHLGEPTGALETLGSVGKSEVNVGES